MLELDATELARIQFALNMSFHILFPAVSIGLAWLLLFFRIQYTRGRSEAWEFAYYFWVKVFALTFALGVVSGVTMSFQFGTNWPGFIERAGNITGPLLGYEVLTAFFIEATFLGIMLFGKDRVSNGVHLWLAALVAIGTTLSAFWILSLNSWMQTPQGHEIVDGKFYAVDWLAIIFNPSFPYRFAHMLVASLLTTAFLLAGTSASRMLRNVARPRHRARAAHRRAARSGARAAADRARRPARSQHARASAGEDRGDRRYLGNAGRCAADVVRHSRRGRGPHAFRARDSARGEPDPHA